MIYGCLKCGNIMKVNDDLGVMPMTVLECPSCRSNKEDNLDTIAASVVETVKRKNADYGNSYHQIRDEFGPVAFYVRLADKVARIKQVDEDGARVASETALDTLRDIIGYCLLEIAYREKQMPPQRRVEQCGE